MIAVLNLGRCDFTTALRLQETLVELRQQNRVPNVLLLVEHPPVITLGRNARRANIVAPRSRLTAQGVEVHEINRGGDVTFHGPGQLVAYPIFDLRSFTPKLGVIAYVRRLEEVLMRICAHYRIETQRIAGMTGLWTLPTAPPRLRAPARAPAAEDGPCPGPGGPYLPSVGKCGETGVESRPPYSERKIAAIGVHVSRAVTSHGFALNVTTDLSFFQLIVPCGLRKPVTSIELETGLRPPLEEVMTIASRTFGQLFQSQMLWLESIHDLAPAAGSEALPDLAPAAGAASVAAYPAAERLAPTPPGSTPHPTDTPIPVPQDTPARAPEPERRIASDDTHLA